MSTHENLKELLNLESIEVNLFRGFTHDQRQKRIFGGQVIAQALMAAYRTVEDRFCHSLHCYFIRPGDPKVPIIYEVDRIIAKRGSGSRTQYLILWKGYPLESSTWEPASSVDAPQALAEFNESVSGESDS